jgi:hypothetical protein
MNSQFPDKDHSNPVDKSHRGGFVSQESNGLPTMLVTLSGFASTFIRPDFPSASWCLQPDGTSTVSELVCLNEGDHVRISDPSGKVLFDGIINPVYSLVEPPRISLPITGRETPPSGFFSAWNQKDWAPNAWAALFVSGTNRLELERAKKRYSDNLPTAA